MGDGYAVYAPSANGVGCCCLIRGDGVRVGDGVYRCDICGRVPREEVYIRGWVLDEAGKEVEVEPAAAEGKHICVVCEVMGVYMLGMPPARQKKRVPPVDLSECTCAS